MAEWLKQASQWHEMYCHDLAVMGLHSILVKLGVRVGSKSYLNQKYQLPEHQYIWEPVLLKQGC